MLNHDRLMATDWRQVGIAATALNVATGLAFGSFGTLVLAIEQEYHASRSTSSLLLSLMLVSMSISASLLGKLLESVSIRLVMAGGAGLCAVAFTFASFAQTSDQLLAIYLVLLGPGTAMLGFLPAMTLASRWSTPARRGMALGVINLPVMVMIVPLAIVPVLESEGIRTVYRLLAGIDLLILPLLLMVRDRPPALDLPRPETSLEGKVEATGIARSPTFWILVFAVGLIVGAGTAKLAHFVPLLIGQGRTFAEANLLLALSGGAGLVGSFAFGWLADRIGGTMAMLLNALVQAATWTILLAPVTMPILVVDAIIVGACGGGVQACLGVALATLFGSRAFSRALGLASLLNLPLLFGMTPLTSLLFEATGNYHVAIGALIGGFLVAALCLSLLPRQERRARAAILEETR